MMTALYVFIGVLAAALVIYIFDQLAGFIRRIKRKLDENNVTNRVNCVPPRNLYNSCYGMYGQYSAYVGDNFQRLIAIHDKLDRIENKIDTLIEDAAELMVAKERPEE